MNLIFHNFLTCAWLVALTHLSAYTGRLGYIDKTDLNYYFIPVMIITLGSYFIADVFFGVYEMAVDTLFLCFLEVRSFVIFFVKKAHFNLRVLPSPPNSV